MDTKSLIVGMGENYKANRELAKLNSQKPGLFEGDNLLNQIVNISKAGAYDILAEQVKELKAEKESLKEVVKQFIHATEHEGVIQGRVVDAVSNAKSILKILKPY